MKHKSQGQNNEFAQNKNNINGLSRFKKIKLRTMNSDKNSIQQQGGGEPKPYTPDESVQNKQQGAPLPPQDLPKQQENQGSDQGGGQPFSNEPFQDSSKKQFPPVGNKTDQKEVVFPPQPINQGGDEEPPEEKKGEVRPINSKGNKKIFIISLLIIIVASILIAGYLFILPIFSAGDKNITDDNQPANVPEEPADTEDVNQEEDFNVPIVPTESNDTDTEDTDSPDPIEDEDVNPQASNEIPVDSHKSLFTTPVDSVIEKIVSPINIEKIKDSLEISSTEVPLFREIVLTDNEENIIQTDELLGVLTPEIFSEAKNNFQADSTVYTYTNDSGTWFGMILKAKSSADVAQLKTQIADIENNVDIVKNFFLTEVNDESSWKDGGANDVTSRYLSFGDGNASFNYGWSNDMLIISTSYQSFKEAVNKI